MVTPLSRPTSPGAPLWAPDLAPDSADREAASYLGNVVLPALGEKAPRALRDAVRRAARDHRLQALDRLSGRHRHELLILIEQLAERRPRPSPGVLVRLTSVVSATPSSPDWFGVAAARPAR